MVGTPGVDRSRWLAWGLALCLLATGCSAKVGGGGGGGSGGGGGTGGGGTGGGTYAPSLVVTGLKVPQSAYAGDTLTVTYTVANKGDGPSDTEPLVVLIGRHGAGAGAASVVQDTQRLDSIASGASLTGTLQVPLSTGLGAADDDLWLHVDIGNDPAPSPRWKSQELVVKGPACPANPYEPNDTTATANTLTVGQFQVHDLCADPIDWMKVTVTPGKQYGLLVGSQLPDAQGKPTAPGWWLYRADTRKVVDGTMNADPQLFLFTAPTDTLLLQVGELQGPANLGPGSTYRVGVQVAAPDWTPDHVRAGPDGSVYVGDPYVGGRAQVYFTVWNRGYPATGPVKVGIYGAPGVSAGTGGTLLGTTTVAALGTDKSVDTHLTVPIPADATAGVYTLSVVTDPDGTVPELDEGDNVASTTVHLKLPPCTPDAYEPDDSPAEAKTIPLSQTQQHNFCDDTADYLAVDATAGATYYVSGGGTGQEIPYLEVLSPGGQTVAKGYLQSPISFTAGAAGTYLLHVDPGTSSMGPGTDYTIRVDPGAVDLWAKGMGAAVQSTVPGGIVPVSSGVENAGHADAGSYQVAYYLSADTTLDPSDRLLATVTRPPLKAGSTDTARATTLVIPADVAPGSWYLIDVADPGGLIAETDETNNVSPGMALTVAPLACAPDAYEEDDTAAAAKAVTPGTPQDHNQCDDGIDWVKLTAPGPAGYLLQMAFSTAVMDSTVDVFDATGAKVAGPGAGQAQGFWFQVPAAGTYDVRLGDTLAPAIGPASAGAYTLHVDRCDPDAYEPDDTMAEAAPIAVGDTQQHNACDPAHPDWQVFDATAGTAYTVTTGVIGPTIDTVVTLEDPSGTVLVTNDDAKHNSRYSQATWTATFTGKVYVKVVAKAGAGLNSDYTVSLN